MFWFWGWWSVVFWSCEIMLWDITLNVTNIEKILCCFLMVVLMCYTYWLQINNKMDHLHILITNTVNCLLITITWIEELHLYGLWVITHYSLWCYIVLSSAIPDCLYNLLCCSYIFQVTSEWWHCTGFALYVRCVKVTLIFLILWVVITGEIFYVLSLSPCSYFKFWLFTLVCLENS